MLDLKRGYSIGMALAFPTSPSRRSIRVLDVCAGLWVAAWIAIGVLVGIEVHGLKELSTTVVRGGRVLQATQQQLSALDSLPVVGGRIRSVEGVVGRAARSAIHSGTDSRSRTGTLSLLLGIAVALIPTLPVAGLYAPLRWARVQEVRAVRRGLREAHGDPAFEQFLALRAMQRLPFHQLRRLSENPLRDLQMGHHRALADAELARLGIDRPHAAATLETPARSGIGQ
jgi:hypothetical protein